MSKKHFTLLGHTSEKMPSDANTTRLLFCCLTAQKENNNNNNNKKTVWKHPAGFNLLLLLMVWDRTGLLSSTDLVWWGSAGANINKQLIKHCKGTLLPACRGLLEAETLSRNLLCKFLQRWTWLFPCNFTLKIGQPWWIVSLCPPASPGWQCHCGGVFLPQEMGIHNLQALLLSIDFTTHIRQCWINFLWKDILYLELWLEIGNYPGGIRWKNVWTWFFLVWWNRDQTTSWQISDFNSNKLAGDAGTWA